MIRIYEISIFYSSKVACDTFDLNWKKFANYLDIFEFSHL